MAGQIYVATDSGIVQMDDGTQLTIQAGVTRVREGHPLLEGRELLFRKIDVHYDVEEATARPGEVRTVPAPEPAPQAAPVPEPTPVKRGPGRPRKEA